MQNEKTPIQILQEIENIMERWNLARDNDDETCEAIDAVLKQNNYLQFFTKKKYITVK